jgi:hypothetical protein
MMRNILLAGTAAAVLGLGVTSAYALPPTSPYAIWVPQSVDQGLNGGPEYDQTDNGFVAAPPQYYGRGAMTEGRSAYVSRYDEDSAAAPAQDLSTENVTPEDRTYYSRGR